MDSPTLDGLMGECPIVTCKGGKVKGQISQSLEKSAKPVFKYHSIPYGRAPIGKLRFMPPQPAEPWEGILDGTIPTNIPLQCIEFSRLAQTLTPTKTNLDGLEKEMSEDCLNLAVYTPNVDETAKLPVMVWFYGGTFQMGFARDFDGTTLCGLHNVIIVIPNYRIGVFGFFNFGPDSVCSGNAGLLDQNLALLWVRDNIVHFGGDKDNVTIFGESAGGTSVNHHMNSLMSRGLFHKAISRSGQATNLKLFTLDSTRQRTALLNYLGITAEDPAEILEILQELPAEKLLEADVALTEEVLSFFPIVDNKFLVKNPWVSLSSRDFAKVPYMIGCNNTEGHGQLSFFGGVPNFVDGITKDQLERFTEQVPIVPREAAPEINKVCASFYAEDPEDPYRYSKLYGNYCSNILFIAPAALTGEAFVGAGCPVYCYLGCFRLAMNHNATYGPKVYKKAPWCQCDHADDLTMIWGIPFNPGTMSGGAKFTSGERALSKKYMTYITNFAKTGDPNKGSMVEVVWPKHATEKKILCLDTDHMTIGERLSPDFIQFWGRDILAILDKHVHFL